MIGVTVTKKKPQKKKKALQQFTCELVRRVRWRYGLYDAEEGKKREPLQVSSWGRQQLVGGERDGEGKGYGMGQKSVFIDSGSAW